MLLLHTCSLKGDKDLLQNREEIATLRKRINHSVFYFVALWMLWLEDETGFLVA